jgi:hypothetical protein
MLPRVASTPQSLSTPQSSLSTPPPCTNQTSRHHLSLCIPKQFLTTYKLLHHPNQTHISINKSTSNPNLESAPPCQITLLHRHHITHDSSCKLSITQPCPSLPSLNSPHGYNHKPSHLQPHHVAGPKLLSTSKTSPTHLNP